MPNIKLSKTAVPEKGAAMLFGISKLLLHFSPQYKANVSKILDEYYLLHHTRYHKCHIGKLKPFYKHLTLADIVRDVHVLNETRLTHNIGTAAICVKPYCVAT